jgi:CO dehydrogenase maturation factor
MARSIAVAGKGGVGKTTVAALCIRYLKANVAGPILAMDADPDSNLGAVLGLPAGTSLGQLREEIQKQIKDFPAGMSKENYIEMGLQEIIVESDKVDLITMGRGEGPGCYCMLNHLLRKFADSLIHAYQWIVMDTEAGLEHLSRRTTTQIDDLIVVVADSPLAVDCARRVKDLVDSLGNLARNQHFVLNAVREDREESLLRRMRDVGLNYLGAVPYDAALVEALYDNKPIFDVDPGPAVTAVYDIMNKIGGR